MNRFLSTLSGIILVLGFTACHEDEPVYDLQKKRMAGIWTEYPAERDKVTEGLCLTMDGGYEFTHLNGTIISETPISWDYNGEKISRRGSGINRSDYATIMGGLLYLGDKVYEPGKTEYSLTECERPLVGTWVSGYRAIELNGDKTGMDGTTPIMKWSEVAFDNLNIRWKIRIQYTESRKSEFYVTGPTDSFTIDGVTFTRP